MTSPVSDGTLKDFHSYEAFEAFSRSLFELEPEEYEGLYRVMQKLESIGEDPVERMLSWKKDTCENDCTNFIRFMIHVDEMELDSLQVALADQR